MTGRIDARRAGDAERPVIERLIQLYLHDMTEFNPFPIGRDGLYEYGMLDQFWQRPFLIYSDDEIAGFALVIEQCPITGAVPCWFMAELFVLKPYRRQGFATGVCLGIFGNHPGLWHIGVIERNATATAFWQNLFDPFEVSGCGSCPPSPLWGGWFPSTEGNRVGGGPQTPRPLLPPTRLGFADPPSPQGGGRGRLRGRRSGGQGPNRCCRCELPHRLGPRVKPANDGPVGGGEGDPRPP